MTPDCLRPALERVRPWLQAALRDDPRSTVDDIEIDLRRGDSELWLVIRSDLEVRAAVVTREMRYPRCWSLLIQLLGGEGMDDWLYLIDQLEAYAASRGCSFLEVAGRVGWERALASRGYTRLYSVVSKEV